MDAAHGRVVALVGKVLGPLGYVALMLWPDLGLDAPQRRVAAIAFWTATWWITAAVPVAATSLLPAALFPLHGVLGARDVAPMYMHDLVMLFIGAFVVALGLQRWGVHRRMALAIIALVGTGPRNLVLGFMVAAAFLSLWINNTSTTLLMLPIALAVAGSMREGEAEPDDPLATSMLLGVAYASSVGGMGTPVGTVPNQIFLGMLHELFPSAPEIAFGRWVLAWLPLVLLFLPAGWWILTRVAVRVPAKSGRGADAIREERWRLGPMTAPQRRMSILFGATALLWMTRVDLDLGFCVLPGWVEHVVPAAVSAPERFVTDATVATVMALLCFLIPSGERPHEALMDWSTARRLPWEVLLLIGGGFALAGGFRESGLDRVLGELLEPLFRGHADWFVVAVVVVFMAALTEVTSNTATTAVLLPVLGQASVAAGVSPLLTMAPATIAASAAFMLPVATPPNAVVFSSGLVPAPTMARVGVWMNVLMAILITLVFELWVRRVLGIGSELPSWAG